MINHFCLQYNQFFILIFLIKIIKFILNGRIYCLFCDFKMTPQGPQYYIYEDFLELIKKTCTVQRNQECKVRSPHMKLKVSLFFTHRLFFLFYQNLIKIKFLKGKLKSSIYI